MVPSTTQAEIIGESNSYILTILKVLQIINFETFAGMGYHFKYRIYLYKVSFITKSEMR